MGPRLLFLIGFLDIRISHILYRRILNKRMGSQQPSTIPPQQQNIEPQHDCAHIPKGKERSWKPSSKCEVTDKGNRKMSEEERQMVFNTLQNHFIFGKLDKDSIEKIINLMARGRVRAGCYILRKGQEPQALHILSEGKLQIEFINQKIQKNTVLERGSIFGELAIVYHCCRSASIRAVTDAVLWTISTADIIEVMRQALQIQGGNYYKSMIIRLLEIFIRRDKREQITKHLVECNYKSSQVIYQKDTPADIVYFVAKGILVESNNQRKIQAGEILGDEQLYNISTRQSSVVCQVDAVLIGCNFSALQQLLGSRISQFIAKCHLKTTIKSVSQFSTLQQSQILQIMAASQITPVLDYDCPDSRYQKTLYLWMNWSFNSLIYHKVFPSKQQVMAYLQTQCHQGYICQIPFYQCLKKNGRVVSINNLDDQQVTLQQLQLIKKIGQGQFSNVFLARTNQNIGLKGNLLAVKCINKQLVRQRQLQQLINNQKNIMSSIHSNSIVKYLGCLEDTQAIYLMMEYLEGYELFHVMREIGLFDRQSAMFVFGFLWHSMEHLHSKHIIYRDFKPQNIMVLQDGYCKLVDMGTAKIIKQQNKFRTSTILGTPHYMAPQAFSQRGYSFQTDVWSIGVILYELVCGRLPFGQDCTDPMQIARQIMANPLQFPSDYKDQQGRQLITMLLQKFPHKRPNRQNYGDIRQHPYVEGLKWNQLLVKTLDSPLKNHQPRKKSYLQGILNKFLEKFVSLNESKSRQPISSINFLN